MMANEIVGIAVFCFSVRQPVNGRPKREQQQNDSRNTGKAT